MAPSLAPSQPKGPTLQEFLNGLSAKTPKGALDSEAAQKTWNAAVRSTTAANNCLQLTAGEWEKYLQVLLASCFNPSNVKSIPAIAWAASVSSKEFKQQYEEDLVEFFKNFTTYSPHVVTHLSKVVHTATPNNVYSATAPATQDIGHLCSGDLQEHSLTLGSSQSYAGKRHFFEGAAWRDGEWVQVFEELRDEDSLTSAFLLKMGASEELLKDVRHKLETRQPPASVDHLMRQVYAFSKDAEEILITPVPSVAMLSFLMSAKPSEGRYLSKHRYAVGGTQAGNAGGISASGSGKFAVLQAQLPAMLAPNEQDVLKGIAYPASLLKRVSRKAAVFLLADTAAWPNDARKSFLNSRIRTLLEVVTAPLLAALDYLNEHSEVLKEHFALEQLKESESPFAAILLGDTSLPVRTQCATALAAHLAKALGPKVVLAAEHDKVLIATCSHFVDALWA